jgi:hypothetical protein
VRSTIARSPVAAWSTGPRASERISAPSTSGARNARARTPQSPIGTYTSMAPRHRRPDLERDDAERRPLGGRAGEPEAEHEAGDGEGHGEDDRQGPARPRGAPPAARRPAMGRSGRQPASSYRPLGRVATGGPASPGGSRFEHHRGR